MWGSAKDPFYPDEPTLTSEADYIEFGEKLFEQIESYLDQNWVHVKTDRDITMSELNVPGQAMPTFKIEGIFPGSAKSVFPVFDSSDFEVRGALDKDLLAYEVVEKVNDYITVCYSAHKVPYPVSNRDYVGVTYVKKLDDGTLMRYSASINHPDKEQTNDYVRVKSYSASYVIPTGKNSCKVISIIYIDPMGNIPQFVINAGKESGIKGMGKSISYYTKHVMNNEPEEEDSEYAFDSESSDAFFEAINIEDELEDIKTDLSRLGKEINSMAIVPKKQTFLDMIKSLVPYVWPLIVIAIYHRLRN